MENETKTIKGINPQVWAKFKMLAVKNRASMGELLTSMVETYEKNNEETWNKILHSGRILSDEEAEDMHRITKKIRKENWVRNAAHT